MKIIIIILIKKTLKKTFHLEKSKDLMIIKDKADT